VTLLSLCLWFFAEGRLESGRWWTRGQFNTYERGFGNENRAGGGLGDEQLPAIGAAERAVGAGWFRRTT
jgi:hypothetical protein